MIALRLLEVAGLDADEDITKRQLGVGESVQALRDGSIEAFFWSGGVPTGAVTDLATTDEIRLLALDRYLEPMRERFGEAYAEAEVEDDEYAGVPGTTTIGVPNLLMVNEDMSVELAPRITQELYEGKDRLATVVPAAESLDPAKGREVVEPEQLHPGAQRCSTAAAGIIVAVVSLTGLGLELSGLIVDAAGESLTLTAIFSAIAVLILGLAVPATASFIIAAVIIAPALIALEVEDFVAYMFIFYYAVLSEVSPPTALSAFAAAAITSGDGFKTMMLTARYTLPAFLVSFAFVLSDNGEGLLLQGDVETIVLATVVAAVAVGGLAVALGGWLRGPVSLPVRLVAGVGSVLMLSLESPWMLVGLAALAVAVGAQLVLSPRAPHPARPDDGT